MEAAGNLCDLLHRDLFLPVSSDQGHKISLFGLWNPGKIHHELIHADAAEDLRALSVDQHFPASGQVSRISVPVTGGDCRDLHRPVCLERSSVADFSSRPDLLDIRDKALQGHRRLHREDILSHLIRRVQTVDRDPGADCIHVHLLHLHDPGTVGTMADRNLHACCLHSITEVLKPVILLSRTSLICLIRSRKMREHAVDLHSRKRRDLFYHLHGRRVRSESDPAHSGIHRDMDMGCLFQLFCSF